MYLVLIYNKNFIGNVAIHKNKWILPKMKSAKWVRKTHAMFHSIPMCLVLRIILLH